MPDYLDIGIDGFKDLFTYLTNRSKTKEIHKHSIMRELRDNIKLLEHRNKLGVNVIAITQNLQASSIAVAYAQNFNFNKLIAKHEVLTADLLLNKRQEKYLAWDCKKIIYNLEGKINDIKNLPKLYNNLDIAPINLPLRLDNLFYQLVLFALFLRKNEA